MISLRKNQSPNFQPRVDFISVSKAYQKSNMFKHPLFHALMLLCHDEPSFNFLIIVKLVLKLGKRMKGCQK